MSNTQPLQDDASREELLNILDGFAYAMSNDQDYDAPAITYHSSDDAADAIMPLIQAQKAQWQARLEQAAAKGAELVVKKEIEMGLLCYRAVKHRISMKDDVEKFVDERLEWYKQRLQTLIQPQGEGEK